MKMEMIIKENYDEMSLEAAKIVRDAIVKKPDLVLGLATGNTLIGTYKELVRMHQEEGLDFSKVTTFNLDEYIGIPTTHMQSYHYFMWDHLFKHININPQNIYIPTVEIEGWESFCKWYEEQIKQVGGIEVQLLGIGKNGHIGFNEPGTPLDSRTTLIALTKETIVDNAKKFFEGEVSAVPRFAITMGVGTILEADMCVLLASGEEKAEAIAKCIEGEIASEITASALQLHPNVRVILDREAASKLHHRSL